MNVWVLCIFCLVPLHHAAVHDAELTVCPDYAAVLRFEKALMQFPIPRTETAISEESLIPEVVPELSSSEKAESVPETPASELTAQKAPTPETSAPELTAAETPATIRLDEIRTFSKTPEPAPLTIPETETPVLLPAAQPKSAVRFASVEEPVPAAEKTVPTPNASSRESAARESAAAEEVPVRRPWGVLTFCVFLLLLSLSANVFLGWQLVELRKMKLK